jgi:hypothetical protein|tara:strand:- start:165 stop:278 length:114 start_codon:yes stop_codon:yes gene_type:complete
MALDQMFILLFSGLKKYFSWFGMGHEKASNYLLSFAI